MTNQTVTQILKNLKAVVFDIDGTIMDSVSRIVKCLQESCMAFGLPAPEKDACKNVIGLTLPEAIAALLPNESQDVIDKVTERYRIDYTRSEDEKPTQLFKNAVSLFEALKANGYKIGIATGKSRKGYNRVIKNTTLGKYVDASVTGDEVRSKPDPQMLLSLSDKLLVPAKAILMVGDSTLDLAMANKINMPSAGVLTGVHNEETLKTENPLLIVPDLADLGNAIFEAREHR